MNNTLVFIHGLESSSQGNKGQFFRTRFADMIIEDYTGDFETRMRKLEAMLQGKDRLILVGSSFGGLMAARFALNHPDRIAKLILLAPALNLEGFANIAKEKLTFPVVVIHGDKDDVVEPQAVRAIAEKVFTRLKYHRVDDDHPLTRVFPTLDWERLLQVS